MAIHKLEFDEFNEIDYHLIAIHTSLEDYRLAYFINQMLAINLSKSEQEIHISIKEGETKFSRFYYFNNENAISWNLLQNKSEVTQLNKNSSQNLFSTISMEVSTKVYLLPEYKKVDYFLKIENAEEILSIIEIQSQLNKIENITTAYTVETSKLKSKYNLIF